MRFFILVITSLIMGMSYTVIAAPYLKEHTFIVYIGAMACALAYGLGFNFLYPREYE